MTIELEEFKISRPKVEEEIKKKIEDIDTKILTLKQSTKDKYFNGVWELQKERRNNESQVYSLKHKEASIIYSMRKQAEIPSDSLKDFELSNVVRLGLAKEVREFYANSQTLEIPNDRENDRSYINVDLDIDVDSNTDNILTELGELFISACKDKKQNSR